MPGSSCWRASGARAPWSTRTGRRSPRRSTRGPTSSHPNLAEAEGLLLGRADETVEAGDPAKVRQRAAAAAAGLVARGARTAIVTAGAAGAAVVVEGGEPRWHGAPQVEVRNPIGAGDALVGGLCVGLERGEPFDSAVARGLATAAASVETAKAGAIDPSRAEELASMEVRAP